MRETVERTMRGDREAFGGLVGRTNERAYALATRILRDTHLAESGSRPVAPALPGHLMLRRRASFLAARAHGRDVRDIGRSARTDELSGLASFAVQLASVSCQLASVSCPVSRTCRGPSPGRSAR